jgi:hypothetical protein
MFVVALVRDVRSILITREAFPRGISNVNDDSEGARGSNLSHDPGNTTSIDIAGQQ